MLSSLAVWRRRRDTLLFRRSTQLRIDAPFHQYTPAHLKIQLGESLKYSELAWWFAATLGVL